jgi:cyclic-di-GMP phosphodiesterase, flagellum assembly factor TipF
MAFLYHILIATVYTLLAAATAIGLPHLFPEIGAEIGAILGAVVFVGSAVLHEVFARQEMQANLVDELGHLRNRNAELQISLDRVERETEILKGAVKKIAENGMTAKDSSKKNVDTVIAEVKVLQGLVKQLSAVKPTKVVKAVGDVAEAAFPAPAMESGSTSSNIALVASEGAVVAPLIGDNGPPISEALPAQISQSNSGQAPEISGLDDDSILEILRDGLEQNRVDLVLQPIVQLPQRKRVFYEAFTRIRDQNGDNLVPEQYIGIAEREGLVTAIDNMLLFRCVQLVRRTQNSNQDIGFFCNISAHSLTDRHFFSDFVEFMADNARLAPNLIFEFPYATVVNRDHDIEQHLKQLASLGFQFSVDQVSSLNIDCEDLIKNRFKYVKFDAEILLDEVRNPMGPIAVADIKRVFNRQGMDLIVEKIETEPQLLDLLDLKIDYGQGYLFGKPRLARVE